jgi:hypothetical protein
MSDIPSHMSSGQILPAYGLASAGASQAPGAQTMTALEFMDLEDSGEDSDSIDKAPFFGYEVGGGVALSECCDKGKGNEVVMEDYLGENESQSSGSSSSSSSSDDELGGVKIMDFLREMEARCETLTAFPAYGMFPSNPANELSDPNLTTQQMTTWQWSSSHSPRSHSQTSSPSVPAAV